MLSAAVNRYIALQCSVGFKFRTPGSLLKNFATYADAQGDTFVRSSRALEWAAMAPSPAQRRNRLLTVRRFSLAMQAEDSRNEAPAADALGPRSTERRVPHIYAPSEINALIAAAGQMPPLGSIRPLTYSTLFGLLAATGMRISEALALRLDDVTEDGLIVRETKFHKSRLLPLHDTTRKALDAYLSASARRAIRSSALLVSANGAALPHSTVVANFLTLVRSIGLRGEPGKRGPRVHDLRHTFAVRSLEQCGPDREAVARHIVALSTYLGHAHISDTYWYLHATPSLLENVADACEALHIGGAA